MQQLLADRDISEDAGQSDCKSPSLLLSVHRSVFTDPFSNSLLLTIQIPDTLAQEGQQCSLLSSCEFSMSLWFAHALFFCTFSVEACPPAHFSCSHSTPLTLTSSSSIPSSRTTSQVKLPINKPCEDPQDEECGPVANTTSSHVSPNVIDNFDYSETYTAIFQNDPVDIDTEPSYSFDAELDDELIRKALASPMFTREREESAILRQTYHSHQESLLPVSPFSHEQVRRDPYTNQGKNCRKVKC